MHRDAPELLLGLQVFVIDATLPRRVRVLRDELLHCSDLVCALKELRSDGVVRRQKIEKVSRRNVFRAFIVVVWGICAKNC